MAAEHSNEEQDGLIRAYHEIPDAEKLKTMSFIELCLQLASCEKDSPKFLVIERELKKHIARDQAKATRPNILLGAVIAGFFTVLGAFVGGFLKTCPSCQATPPTAAAQTKKGDFGVKPPVTDVAPSQPAGPPAKEPSAVQSNAQSSNAKP